jgi:hypothetical protein
MQQMIVTSTTTDQFSTRNLPAKRNSRVAEAKLSLSGICFLA